MRKDEIPKSYQDELKSIYISSCEMLKTYHAMFPPKNTEQELKVNNLKELNKFLFFFIFWD